MLYDFNFNQHPVAMLVLSGMLVLSFIIYLFYYLVFFRKLARKKNKKTEQTASPSFPVSIVIAAKNEYLNLKENLPFLLNQDYEDFEIVVVDDHSTDDTWDLLCLPHSQSAPENNTPYRCSCKQRREKISAFRWY